MLAFMLGWLAVSVLGCSGWVLMKRTRDDGMDTVSARVRGGRGGVPAPEPAVVAVSENTLTQARVILELIRDASDDDAETIIAILLDRKMDRWVVEMSTLAMRGEIPAELS